MVERDDQPFTRSSCKGRRDGLKVSRATSLGRFDQPLARVAAAQRPGDLALELIERLDRVPAGCPKMGYQRRRRLAFDRLRDDVAVGKLFGELGPRFKERPGGYLRILKMGYRAGDAAPMAVVQLLDQPSADAK